MKITPKDNTPEALTPTGIFKDALVTFLLIGSAWLINHLWTLFVNGVPFLLRFALFVADITLGIYFLGMVFRAVKWSYSEFNNMVMHVKKTGSWKGISDVVAKVIHWIASALYAFSRYIEGLRNIQFIFFIIILMMPLGGIFTEVGISGILNLSTLFFNWLLLLGFFLTVALIILTIIIRFVIRTIMK